MEKYRDTYSEVNLQDIRDNLDYIYKTCEKPMLAVVKANAYGHGSKKVAAVCENNPHVQMFGVATLGEGVELRHAGIEKDILVLGATREEDAYIASDFDITINVFSVPFAKAIASCNFQKSLKVHIKLDTGMNRIGLKTAQEFEEVLAILGTNPEIIIEGVFTHYGASDELNRTYDDQFARFKEILKGHTFKYIHAANTAGALYHHETFTNMVRAGIAIYGIEPNGQEDTPLKQAMSLKSRITMVKPIKKGEKVGYGFTYTAKKDEYLATVPIGYADGLIRKNQNRMVYIQGRYYQIVGRICMDQMMVRVDEHVAVGDEIEIFGPHISLNQMAKELDTIPYEILCLVSERVKRIYTHE